MLCFKLLLTANILCVLISIMGNPLICGSEEAKWCSGQAIPVPVSSSVSSSPGKRCNVLWLLWLGTLGLIKVISQLQLQWFYWFHYHVWLLLGNVIQFYCNVICLNLQWYLFGFVLNDCHYATPYIQIFIRLQQKFVPLSIFISYLFLIFHGPRAEGLLSRPDKTTHDPDPHLA